MKRSLFVLLVTILLFACAACTAGEEKSETAAQTASAVQSREEDPSPQGSSALPAEELSAPLPNGSAEEQLYTQQTTDGTEGAALMLTEDGSFVFRPVFYDGSPSVTGTYETVGDSHILTPLETTAHNIALDELGTITLQRNGDRWIYRGAEIGETYDGAVFAPS